MERAKMYEILKEQGFQQTGVCDETSCAIEMGKLLAVKYIVLGNVGKVGKTFTLNIRIVEIGSLLLHNVIKELSYSVSGITAKLTCVWFSIQAQ